MWIKTKFRKTTQPGSTLCKMDDKTEVTFHWDPKTNDILSVMVGDPQKDYYAVVYESDEFRGEDPKVRVQKQEAQCRRAFDYIQYCLEREHVDTTAPFICDLTGRMEIPRT